MIEFLEIEGMPDTEVLTEIREFYASIFENVETGKFEKRIGEAIGLFTVLALNERKIAGFKIGYQLEPKIFYSWVGGVDAKFRGQKIAAELMKRQHEWCAANGFEKVRTKTKNSFKPMLILNIKNGFDIIEVYQDKTGELKIVLEKQLSEI